MALLDRETIIEALARLNRRLEARNERAELFLLGGAAPGPGAAAPRGDVR